MGVRWRLGSVMVDIKQQGFVVGVLKLLVVLASYGHNPTTCVKRTGAAACAEHRRREPFNILIVGSKE